MLNFLISIIMESETFITTYQSSIRERMLAAAGPVLWIALSYVDPGKWAAAVEGGARFGFDLALLMLVINFTAIFCQYLSTVVSISTGKDLAQICNEEYDPTLCIFLGVQAEISMVALDLTMVLGTAYGLNAVFGIDIFNCVFLTGFDALLFPFLTSIFENPKAKFFSICMAGVVLASYIFGILLSQPESSSSTSGTLVKLNGESAYALMSLLGANIMPHNFYLHSSLVQQNHGQQNVSKGAICQDHFLATLCIFSGIFLLNYMLMNLAASMFYSTGVVFLTLQDALSLLDQVFRSSMAPFALILIMFFSNQLVALTWYHGKQVIVQDFFKIDIPGWLHRATIRIISIIPALYCVWNSGVEGIFQLLIFTQVVIALLLPSSVVPLFRIASSRSIMGAYKVSQLVEFFTLISFIGILGIKIIFIVEMIFGSSDWVSNLKWNISNNVPIPYFILLTASFTSLCLMLWLVITPLKSTSSSLDSQALSSDKRIAELEPSADGNQLFQHNLDSILENQEPELSFEKSFGDYQNVSVSKTDLELPEAVSNSAADLPMTSDQVISSGEIPSTSFPGSSAATEVVVLPLSVPSDVLESELPSTLNDEQTYMPDKPSQTKEDLPLEKDDCDTWEPDESVKDVHDISQSLTSEGPNSLRSLSGKNDDMGSGAGSLSRLAGLGRTARRQFTTILDDFWRQIFDFHGQATQEAKTKKLDVLLGIESKVDTKSTFSSGRSDSVMMQSMGNVTSVTGRGSDSLTTPGFYNPPKLQIVHSSISSPHGVPQGSSIWSTNLQSFPAFVQSSSSGRNRPDYGEGRYYSVHVPSSSDVYDQQPATVHGYDLASYLGRIAKEKGSDYQLEKLDALTQLSPLSEKSNSKDLFPRTLGQQSIGSRTSAPPGFHNVNVSRNVSFNPDRSFQDISSPERASFVNSTDVKKFYSLPDISGLYIPHRDSAANRSQWDNSTGYGQSTSRLARENTSLGVNERSPSKLCGDVFPQQFNSSSAVGSLWTKQPYEQFGVGDKHPLNAQENPPTVDMESKILQSFRSCIMKLLKLEGFDWLFRQNDGTDEDLVDRVAAREKVLYEVEVRASDRKLGTAIKNDDAEHMKFMSVPNCGEGCVWRAEIIVSFGVWCIHRILELSLMESRPELWGKYTYVLNRLQGIIDLAFMKPRSPTVPCFCLEIPPGYERRSGPPTPNGNLPPPARMARGKFTTAAMLLDMIKDVEIAISCRKGRAGTAAGDVAFPKGKENLASVLKRYKRRLSSKPVGTPESGTGTGPPRKVSSSHLSPDYGA